MRADISFAPPAQILVSISVNPWFDISFLVPAPPGQESPPMKFRGLLMAVAVCAAALLPARAPAAATSSENTSISIIPKPEKMVVKAGAFIITPGTKIIVDKKTRPIGEYLAGLLAPATGMKLSVTLASGKQWTKNIIALSIGKPKKNLGAEGYELTATRDSVRIFASTPVGVFHGVQTLRQLLPVEIESAAPVLGIAWSAPCVSITDRPRFAWRGLMLDPARYFLPKEFVLKYIDYMSLYKLNRLHLHLTDDQGWRLEIKQYPELTKVGAWRGKSGGEDMFWHPTGEPHGGFYTQEDMREIIAFAASRYVTIVPEIEMPGHSQAALASVPGLACEDRKFKVSTHWGVHSDIYCAGNEKVFEFLENVLGEVAALFPGEYLHIGGDEAPKTKWRQCAKCQARIKENKLKNENELQSYFIKRIEKFVISKGKKIIGWDEILQGGLPPDATVMSWQGIEGGIAAARQGHDVVMTPMTQLYFDYPQAKDGEPPAFQGPPLPLCRVYNFEPVPNALTKEQEKHIIGAQGSVWQ
jgi:hexosaminidase